MEQGATVEELEAAMERTSKQIFSKEQELKALRVAFANLRSSFEELQDTTAAAPDQMRQTVQELVHNHLQSEAVNTSYESRIVTLELRSLLDRYKLLDVEGMAEQNSVLREEVMRLQQENLKLLQAVAEGDTKARQHTAKIELALEATAREHFREAQDKMRKELYQQMDERTRVLVHEHGALQTQVRELNKQAGLIDCRYRQMSTERQQFKVDAHVADGMNEILSKQMVTLRQQLDQAFLMNRSLEDELVAAEAHLRQAQAQVQRLEDRWQRHCHGDQVDGEAQLQQLLQQQLEAAQQQQAKLRAQRDVWRERCHAHERANADLQAALHTLVDKSGLTLPSGVTQSLESVWRSPQGSPRAVSPQSSTQSSVSFSAQHQLTRQPAGANVASKVQQAEPSSQPQPDGTPPPGSQLVSSSPDAKAHGRPNGSLQGAVSLSRLVHDSAEPVHVVYASGEQPHVGALRPQRTAGSLRYSCARTSLVDVYQNTPSIGEEASPRRHRPVSAREALEAEREVWSGRTDSAWGASPVRAAPKAGASGPEAPEQPASRPGSAMAAQTKASASWADGRLRQGLRPSTAGPTRPARNRLTASVAPAVMFKTRAGYQ